MMSKTYLLLLAILSLGLASAVASGAQTNLAPNPGFEQTASGDPPCRYTWENDGPCAPEYYVQQYPDEAFHAGLETLNGDNVFTVQVLRGDLAPSSGHPAVNLKYTLNGVSPGEVYAFSAAVRTQDLVFGTSLRATPKGAAGAFVESRVIQNGPRQTAPWQRVGLQVAVPEGADRVDFVIYVSGALGSCQGECGTAYLDDIEIVRVENLAPNASLSQTASGDPPCRYTWENDGPCAPEYYVQQYPDEAFRAEIRSHGGDNVFAVDVLRDDLPPHKVNFKYTLQGVVPGEVYAFSTAIETDGLQLGTSLRATPKGAQGAIVEARVIETGPNQTTPRQRFGLEVAVPEGATAIDFVIYVSGTLGACGGSPCGSAYFDDISITRVLDHPFSNVCPEGQYMDWARSENDCRQLEVDLAQLQAVGIDCDLKELHRTSAGELSFDPARIFTATDTHLGFKPNAFAAAFAAGGLRDDRFEVAGCTEADLLAALDLAEINGGGTVTLPACEIEVADPIGLPSSTVVQGAGIGRTVLVAQDPATAKDIFRIQGARDIVVRDLSLDGALLPPPELEGGDSGFEMVDVDNVLIERVEVNDLKKTAFSWISSSNFTVRYSAAGGNQTHGFATSDCSFGVHPTLEACLGLDPGGGGEIPDWFWVAGHAVYSNLIAGNVKSGVNSHGLLAEITGNRILGNRQGSKLSQARYFWVHDNLYQGNREDLIRVQTASTVFRQPRHLLIYDNLFEGNGEDYQEWEDGWPTPNLITFTYPGQPVDYGRAMYLIDNDFDVNWGRLAGLFADPLCTGSDEATLFPPWQPGTTFSTIDQWHIRYNFDPQLLPETDPICELTDVHTIFEPELGCSE